LREKYNISDTQLEVFLDELVCKNLYKLIEKSTLSYPYASRISYPPQISNKVIFSDEATSFAALVQMAAASGLILGIVI